MTSFGLDERSALAEYLLGELREGDVVLLKGSRGLQMEDLVAALRADVAIGPDGGDGSRHDRGRDGVDRAG